MLGKTAALTQLDWMTSQYSDCFIDHLHVNVQKAEAKTADIHCIQGFDSC